METKKRPDFAKLRQAAKDARDLAQRLFDNDVSGKCSNIAYKESINKAATAADGCLENETKRLTGHPKLPDGATMRSYSYFDPHKLCSSCVAYWYVEMAAQELARMTVLERQIAAEEGRVLSETSEIS